MADGDAIAWQLRQWLSEQLKSSRRWIGWGHTGDKSDQWNTITLCDKLAHAPLRPEGTPPDISTVLKMIDSTMDEYNIFSMENMPFVQALKKLPRLSFGQGL